MYRSTNLYCHFTGIDYSDIFQSDFYGRFQVITSFSCWTIKSKSAEKKQDISLHAFLNSISFMPTWFPISSSYGTQFYIAFRQTTWNLCLITVKKTKQYNWLLGCCWTLFWLFVNKVLTNPNKFKIRKENSKLFN